MSIDVIIFLILVFIVLFCFTVFMVLSYSGLFVEPHVRTGEPPWSKKSTIAYKFIKGPYNGNEVGATFTEVTSIAPKALTIGIFYDDPHTVQPDRLRSVVGCFIKEEEKENEDKSLVDESTLNLFVEKHFKTHALPEIEEAVLTEFPYTTPFSIWLAPNRVYPRMNNYISSRNLCAYPMIEVYKDCKIIYAAPLSKQEDFFVPESLIEEPSTTPVDDSDETPSTNPNNKKTTPDVIEDESPKSRKAGRKNVSAYDSSLKKENDVETNTSPDVEREVSTLSSLSFDGDNGNEDEAEIRSSRSGSNSSSFEEIGSDDIGPSGSSKKTN